MKEPSEEIRSGAGSKLWPNGSTITVRFLQGVEGQRVNFTRAFDQWLQDANLRVVYVNGNADVRVAFDTQRGSWSFTGTDARTVPQTRPTINLGFEEDLEIPSSYLHEIGHMLGLVHEHLSPYANLRWDKAAVYRAKARLNWDRAAVDRTFFSRYTPENFPGARAFDPQSIMMYAFPPEWFLDRKGFDAPSKLSAGDKQYIASLYPK